MSHNIFPEKIYEFSRTLFSPGSSAVIGVSGGSDSIALLFLLVELKERLGITHLVVAHLNHGLRGEASDGDGQLVKEYSARLGLQFYTKRLSGLRLEDPGLEAAAREERYRFFDEVRAASGCRLIATGHTMDDQAETVLMRIMRGSGLNGLRGIAPLREDGIVRPLLSSRKLELLYWLAAKKIAFRTDGSNSDIHFLRNRVRQAILPQLETTQPGVVEHLAALATEAGEQWHAQQQRVSQWLRRHLFSSSDNSFRIDRGALDERDLASEGLRQLFVKRGITPYRRHILPIFENSACSGRTFLLPDGWRYRIGRESIYFEKSTVSFNYGICVPGTSDCREEQRHCIISIESSVPHNLNEGKWTVYIDGAMLGDCCTYRTITPDDTLMPFGTDREVNIFRFLAKQGLPLPERERIGCLFNGDNKPVWIPGIRLDERFRVTGATKKVIKVQFRSFL